MSSEYVSRELFEERGKRYLDFFESDKENIKMLTAIINRHETAIEKLIMLEEKSSEEQRKAGERMGEADKRMCEVANSLSGIAAIVNDYGGRLENHAGRLKEIEGKSGKRMEAILMEIVKYAVIALVAGAIGYLIHS